MKIHSLLIPVACLVAGVLGFQTPLNAASSETELEVKMDELNGAYRKLGRQVSDASKNADSLKQVAIIKETATASMKLEPKMKAEIPAGEQAAFVANYQSKMKEFVADIGKLEAALKAGKNDEAANLMKTLKQSQEDGHKQFKKKKK